MCTLASIKMVESGLWAIGSLLSRPAEIASRASVNVLQIVGSSDSPLRPHRSVPNFRDYLCADHEATARNVGSVSLFECGAMPQYCGKNSRVDADRRRPGRHSSRAATNRFHSSSVRSSITNASGPA